MRATVRHGPTPSLWHKIQTVEDPAWTRRYHSHHPQQKAFGGRVSVTLDDGSAIEDEIAVADAHPLGARPFRREHYVAKFRALAEGIVSRPEQNRFLGVVERLPGLSADELLELGFIIDPDLLASASGRGVFDWHGHAVTDAGHRRATG